MARDWMSAALPPLPLVAVAVRVGGGVGGSVVTVSVAVGGSASAAVSWFERVSVMGGLGYGSEWGWGSESSGRVWQCRRRWRRAGQLCRGTALVVPANGHSAWCITMTR